MGQNLDVNEKMYFRHLYTQKIYISIKRHLECALGDHG